MAKKKKKTTKVASKSAVKASANRQASKKGVSRGKTAPQSPAAAPSHDGVFKRMFDRVKPLFRKPLDPRIKHLVEVFGEEAVMGIIDLYRKTRDAVQKEEIEQAVTLAESKGLPPAHGSWAWHELMTNDVPASKRFYRDMFGWESSDIEMMPGFNYALCRHIGKDIAGMMALGPEHGDMRPGWTVYVAVDDVDSAADKAEDLGGEIVVPAHDIPVGRWAMIRDPAGAVICLYKSKT